jgi:hypothetical protein
VPFAATTLHLHIPGLRGRGTEAVQDEVGVGLERISGRKARVVFTHDLERLHTPIALDIGAVTPPEIALAILGDVIATRRSRAADGAATNQNKDITCPSRCPT